MLHKSRFFLILSLTFYRFLTWGSATNRLNSKPEQFRPQQQRKPPPLLATCQDPRPWVASPPLFHCLRLLASALTILDAYVCWDYLSSRAGAPTIIESPLKVSILHPILSKTCYDCCLIFRNPMLDWGATSPSSATCRWAAPFDSHWAPPKIEFSHAWMKLASITTVIMSPRQLLQ